MTYNPELAEVATEDQLRKYAEAIIHCALGNGAGIEAGDKVLVAYTPESDILLPHIQVAITQAGGHMILDPNIPSEPGKGPKAELVAHGDVTQREYFPLEHKRRLFEEADHRLGLRSQAYNLTDPKAGQPAHVARNKVERQELQLRREFQNIWKSHTLVRVPSKAMADQSGVSVAEFWQQVVHACFLNEEDPVGFIRASMQEASDVAKRLNSRDIRAVRVHGTNCDLHVGFSKESRFVASEGGNLPSFEVFTTPQASQTSGWIKFDHPFIHNAVSVEGLWLRFSEGKIVDWSADAGEEAFADFLKIEGTDRLGEFALTDQRLSRVNQALPSATMFLENIGGTMHVALGNGYKKCFVDKETPDRNDSKEHKDLVKGSDFTVTATLADGSTQDIFMDGQFTFV